jgi:hypothetical protein
MNMAQSDEAAPYLREAGVVELLAPLLTIDHYQSLKAAMAITFVCRYDEDDATYDLLRKTENVIPKIVNLLHNTIAGRGGNGYKYGVFTLRSSVGCIASLASGPEFMKERIATECVIKIIICFMEWHLFCVVSVFRTTTFARKVLLLWYQFRKSFARKAVGIHKKTKNTLSQKT